jgi:hypothetical protein
MFVYGVVLALAVWLLPKWQKWCDDHVDTITDVFNA